jgi:enoyl-CoA hydratase
MTHESLGYEQRGPVAIVSIEDAPHNRMSLAFMDALEERVAIIAADTSVRAVVMTAAGDQNFSVGMNLKELVASLGDPARVDAILDQRLRVLAAIENMDKPWVATLFGNCLGGGLELPLACHFRLAAETGARIGLPELHLGSVPAWGGSCLVTSDEKTLEQSLRDEREAFHATLGSPDMVEGMTAFMSKRKPVFGQQ